MKELWITLDRMGSTTKLRDENGVEIRNVKSVRICADGNGPVTATLEMTEVHVRGYLAGENVFSVPVEMGPENPPAEMGQAEPVPTVMR